MAIVAISRGTLSGGEELAERIGRAIGHPVLGREVLVAAAEKAGISEAELTKKMERGPGWWERLTSSRRLYITAMRAALVERVAEGRLVYHGHAGHLLLTGIPKVLRVRVITSRSRRLRSVMRSQQLSRPEAERYLRHVDEERKRWTQFVYGVDWADPALYDVVVNLERATIGAACDAISALVRQPEFTLDDQQREAFADLILTSRVQLALAKDPSTHAFECDVRAANGRVEVSCALPSTGVLPNARERAESLIRRTIGGAEGVHLERLDIRCVNPND
jgi:cytidylate kinase